MLPHTMETTYRSSPSVGRTLNNCTIPSTIPSSKDTHPAMSSTVVYHGEAVEQAYYYKVRTFCTKITLPDVLRPDLSLPDV
jgi:hypothetical protein